MDFRDTFREHVIGNFVSEYACGRTPNPCVMCNSHIKWGKLMQAAEQYGCDYIATGHYCKIAHENGIHFLQKAKDQNKDQTYFLNQLSQDQLKDVLFPLGKLDKPEVRKIAEQYGLATAAKKDSTGICFIGERNFRQFLMNYLPAKSGEIRTYDGRVLGTHVGLMYYTIGQRKGLDIGGQKGDEGRWFVIEKDLKNNVLYVAHGEEDKLFSSGLTMDSCNWIPNPPKDKEFHCTAKFRYRQPEQGCTVKIVGENGTKDSIVVTFDEKQRAITEGQYAVFYDGDKCIGGGVIESAIK